jgi:succinate dehydrogenase / fumarate reductase cytochrome b subunit
MEGYRKDPNLKPLSPFLTIYRAQLSSTLSIFHRISGIFLFFYWCYLLFFISIMKFLMSWYSMYWLVFHFKRSSFFIFTFFILLPLFPFFYHLINGIRHFIWDLGYGLGTKTLEKNLPAYGVLFSSIFVTIITYINL